MRIEDGTGKGYESKVDNNNRLHVDSVGRSQSEQAALNSLNFNIVTSAITLTSANESGVFYFKSDESKPFVIKEILVILGNSTGGSGAGTIELIKNPTAGTLISTATAITTSQNRDFGSSRELSGDIYEGAEARTVTDGTTFASTARTDFSSPVVFDAAPIILRKGSSIAVTYQPPSGNTSQIVRVAVVGFVESSDI